MQHREKGEKKEKMIKQKQKEIKMEEYIQHREKGEND